MKAMILAAGLGTRLKPLTDTRPKALVEVEGEAMLSRVIRKLKSQGFDRLVVNIHHFPEMIREYLAGHDFGVEIEISDESENLLDTGGGIVKAAPLLFRDENAALIHNVDILSNADTKSLLSQVNSEDTDVALLVSDRDSSRKLIFDEDLNLKGWHDLKSERFRPEYLSPGATDNELAFSGIYAISKAAVEEMKALHGKGKYSVMEYLLNPLRSKKVKGVYHPGLSLIDIGKPATLSQAHLFI